MQEIFIKEIKVNDVRNIKNFRIPLGESSKKNLILTGKNGSGKTSLLREIKMYLSKVTNGNLEQYHDQLKHLQSFKSRKEIQEKSNPQDTSVIQQLETKIRNSENWLKQFGGTKIYFNNSIPIGEQFRQGNFIVAFFEAKRNTALKVPTGINKINMKQVYQIDDKAGQEFIQYIVNLKADRSFAKDDNDNETVLKIDNWFSNFESNLFKLFENEKMQLQFDRKRYNFNIIENDKEPYTLNQLSDGYSAILSIVTELIMRMEEHGTKSYDIQGIVLIDEIETHLHIELQKNVLPFLISFFP